MGVEWRGGSVGCVEKSPNVAIPTIDHQMDATILRNTCFDTGSPIRLYRLASESQHLLSASLQSRITRVIRIFTRSGITLTQQVLHPMSHLRNPSFHFVHILLHQSHLLQYLSSEHSPSPNSKHSYQRRDSLCV